MDGRAALCLGGLIWGLCFMLGGSAQISHAAQGAECGIPAPSIDDWQISSQDAAGIDPKILCSLVEHLENTPQDDVHGVVLVRDGHLVFEKYLIGEDERWGVELG